MQPTGGGPPFFAGSRASPSHPKEPPVLWMWQNDEGQSSGKFCWEAYTEDVCEELERRWRAFVQQQGQQPMQKVQMRVRNTDYEFDFQGMTQTNRKTKKQRGIYRSPFSWEWQVDVHTDRRSPACEFAPFAVDEAAKLEEAFVRKFCKTFLIGRDRSVDMSADEQTNVKTGRKRGIRRVPIPSAPPPSALCTCHLSEDSRSRRRSGGGFFGRSAAGGVSSSSSSSQQSQQQQHQQMQQQQNGGGRPHQPGGSSKKGVGALFPFNTFWGNQQASSSSSSASRAPFGQQQQQQQQQAGNGRGGGLFGFASSFGLSGSSSNSTAGRGGRVEEYHCSGEVGQLGRERVGSLVVWARDEDLSSLVGEGAAQLDEKLGIVRLGDCVCCTDEMKVKVRMSEGGGNREKRKLDGSDDADRDRPLSSAAHPPLSCSPSPVDEDEDMGVGTETGRGGANLSPAAQHQDISRGVTPPTVPSTGAHPSRPSPSQGTPDRQVCAGTSQPLRGVPGALGLHGVLTAAGTDCQEDTEGQEEDEDEHPVRPKGCSHWVHMGCLLQWAASAPKALSCPSCKKTICLKRGSCPKGTMTVTEHPAGSDPCAGHEKEATAEIFYSVPPGLQDSHHPSPGTPFEGTRRVGFLPLTEEGRIVLRMLVEAFERGYTFEVGTSLTTHKDNKVVWSGIHHKTSLSGGTHGWPDETYFQRVVAELSERGIDPTEEESERLKELWGTES